MLPSSLATARRLSALLLTLLAVLGLGAATSQARVFSLRATPTAAGFWAANDGTLHTVFHNGQCTQWAAERRPDILRRGTEAIVAHEIAAGQPEDLGDWDAREWPHNAREAGIPTGTTPRAHALVVFQPGVLGAGGAGHIAYVQRVFRDGSFEISQMHAPRLWQVTHARLSAADAHLGGISFIY